MPMPMPSTRSARSADLPYLRAVLAEWFGQATSLLPELLEQAVTRGLASVVEINGEMVGYAVVEMPSAGHIRLSAIAVRPDMRRRGIGSALLADVLRQTSNPSNRPNPPELREPRGDDLGEQPMVSAVAAPMDQDAALFLLARGFIGTRVLRTVTHGSLLIHYQHKQRVEYIDPDARHLVPVAAREQLIESLSPSDHAVTALVELSGEPAFEIARFERDDPAALQSGEAAAGIAFSGAVLAAITFLLGFAFASTRFPDDVRLLLIGATFITMLSLIVYASASGELARIRSNAFGEIMKWGNVLSEYGGVLPFLISLPVIYAQVSGNRWSTLVLAVVLGIGIAAYEWSEFSIAYRFRNSKIAVILMMLTAASPAAGAALIATDTVSWPWTTLLAATLGTRISLYLYRRGAEAGIAEHRRRWQIRR